MQGQKGFTLIEIVVYLAILAVVLYFVGGFAWNTISSGDKLQNSQDINDNGRFMLNAIADAVEESTAISGVSTQ